MKQEDKELLLKDLCYRLPYGVKGMLCEDCVCTLDRIWTKKGYESTVFAGDYYDLDCFKPYLFPLKTMTIEQRNEFYEMTQPHIIASFKEGKLIGEEGEYRPITPIMMYPNMIEIDWLLKHHFDVFGLIEKGLAIDATSLNIYNEIDYETER